MPISRDDATRIVRAVHYSGSVVRNSSVHLGVFLNGRCGGAMQFGPPMDRRRVLPIVTGTAWNEMLELNRMAFADWLPRNSESRALAVAMRWLRKTYPHLKWILSFADGTQCGDGTIYRASGFVLTQINENRTIMRLADGSKYIDHGSTRDAAKDAALARALTMKTWRRDASGDLRIARTTLENQLENHPVYNARWWKARGAELLPGFQLRYVFFLDPSYRARLSVPEIPFSEITARGARMYRGARATMSDVSHASEASGDATPVQGGEGGSTPTRTLPPQK